MTSEFFVTRNQADSLAAAGAPAFTGIQYGTASQALPITLHWGTRRLAPQFIWKADFVDPGFLAPSGPFNPSPPGYGAVGGFLGQLGSGTGSIGSTDPSSTAAQWFWPVIMALCEGPAVQPYNRLWNGGGTTAIPWADITGPIPTGGGIPLSPFYDTTLNGTSTQTAWAWLAANPLGLYTGQALAYRFTALLVTPTMVWGNGNTPPSQQFEVIRNVDPSYSQGDGYGIGVDISPAYYIPDWLTSVQYGMGMASGDIDSTSLANARQYWGAQGLFFSPLLTSQIAGTQFVDDTAQFSNAWIFWSGTAFYFVPLGDEALSAGGYSFTPDMTAAYNLSNNDFIGPLQVDRADPIDCSNRLRIEIADRASGIDYATNPIEWKDTTLINQFGLRDASDIDATGHICDSAVGAIVVELMGKRMAYLRNTYTFTLSYRFVLILPGCLLTISDPNLGISSAAVRVKSVEEDDKFNLKFVAEEYPGTLGISRPAAVPAWSATAGFGTGGGGTPVSGGTGVPVSTTGGGLTLTSGTPSVVILFVAGDIITLPAALVPGIVITFKHDTQRVIPLVPLEGSTPGPATIQRPSGATYTIEDPQDGSLAAASFVTLRESGGTYPFVFDGGTPGIFRSLGG